MVIQCSSCDTRFKIADDKVKAGGVKVRCSKCKEVFTVLPPEETRVAAPEIPEPPADASQLSSEESSSNLDDVDWSSLNGESSEEYTDESDEPTSGISSSDFSFGDDDEDTTFDDEATETTEDEFSFDDEEATPPLVVDEETFSFGSDATSDDDSVGLDEPVGEGAQDEFSFDDTPAASADVDDFDWDGSGPTDAASDDDSFGFEETGSDGDNLDFSSLEMPEDEVTAPLEVEVPRTEIAPPMPSMDEARPATVKGPQKSGLKGRGTQRGKRIKQKSGPLRSFIMLLLLLMLVGGGGLFGLKQMGFWSGNFEELQDVDYITAGQTAWDMAMIEVNKLAGNEVALQPAGSITVTEMNGRYIQNDSSGNLFVITGKVRNDYTSNRSAIAVRGILYDSAGSAVNEQKVYCGNSIDDNALREEKFEVLQVRGTNEFGDSLSNLDVAPGAFLPFAIVFNNLPKNLSEYNVEAADSAAGAKQ